MVPFRVILPPERVIFPEALPKVIPAELTLPETVIVPAARPFVEVPKLSGSAVVVVVLLPIVGSVPPVLLPDHSVLPAELQVPFAVPKPAVPLFVSQ